MERSRTDFLVKIHHASSVYNCKIRHTKHCCWQRSTTAKKTVYEGFIDIATAQSMSDWIWHSEDRASWYILIIKPTRCAISQLYFDKELYMFWTYCPSSGVLTSEVCCVYSFSVPLSQNVPRRFWNGRMILLLYHSLSFPWLGHAWWVTRFFVTDFTRPHFQSASGNDI